MRARHWIALRAWIALGAGALALGAAATAASAPPASTAKAQPTTLAIKVDRIVTPAGSLAPGGFVVVKGGRIETTAAAQAPAGAMVIEIAGGVACPGLIDPVTSLGAAGDIEEPARAFTPEAQAADVLHADHSDFLKAARGGITTVGLSPSSSNVIGGRLAIVRTRGEGGVAQLAGPGPLRMSLTEQAFQETRAPTSRQGALPMLRKMLAEGTATPGPCLIDVETPDEIRVGVELLSAANRETVLLDARGADDALPSLQGRKTSAVLGPYELTTPERALRLPALLDGSGVAVAFTANGNAAALRLTAALAVRNGLPPAKALAALTSVPAHLLGVEGDSGSLEPGKRADLVVFTGDPLDLGAKVALVLVGGVRVESRSRPDPEKNSP